MTDIKRIKHLAWLTRIELGDDEIEKYSSQIEEILGYLDKLDQLEFRDTDIIIHSRNFEELREDSAKVFPTDPLSNIENKKAGFIKGPKMI